MAVGGAYGDGVTFCTARCLVGPGSVRPTCACLTTSPRDQHHSVVTRDVSVFDIG